MPRPGRRRSTTREPPGTGFNIEVHSFPLDGRIVLFPADADSREDEPADTPPPPAPSRNNHTRRR
jgi:hypothetical protein